jgi:c-di-GMP-binding flagellar brake protein YcgR
MSQPEEKRRHPRIAHRVAVQARHEQGGVYETVDLSAGGLCCSASQYVSPMTRMELTFILPSNDGGGAQTGGQEVRGEAVVVRTEPSRPGGDAYRIALLFSRMEEQDRQTLLGFLKSRSR